MQSTVLVIGGSSQIGRAVCEKFAQNGYSVIFTYNSNASASTEVIEMVKKYDTPVTAFRLDLSKLETIKDFFKLVDEFHVMVNCASTIPDRIGIQDMKDEDIIKQTNVIFTASSLLMKYAAEKISAIKGDKSVINITSQAAIFGGNMISIYASAKAALNTLTIALSREYGKYGIRVNAVSPGVIDTLQNKEISEQVVNSIALGRKGTTKEVADVIYWLASKESSYINGAIIPITGGR